MDTRSTPSGCVGYVREEKVTRQLAKTLASIAVPSDWISDMLTELEHQERHVRESSEKERSALQRALANIEQKLDRLTSAYLDGVMELDEYRASKAKTLEQKATLNERRKRFESGTSFWLEPTRKFVTTLREATLLNPTENAAEKSRFLRKTGSNLTLQNKRVRSAFHEPWKTVEKHGRIAQHARAARPERCHRTCEIRRDHP